MVAPKPPFLTSTDIATLHDLVGQGLQTVQDFQEPQLVLAFRRRDPNTGWGDVVTLRPISVRLNNQQAQEAPANLGGTETRTAGTAKVWVGDVTDVSGDVLIQPGDRFTWLGHGCVVDVVPPARRGSIAIDFTVLEGN